MIGYYLACLRYLPEAFGFEEPWGSVYARHIRGRRTGYEGETRLVFPLAAPPILQGDTPLTPEARGAGMGVHVR